MSGAADERGFSVRALGEVAIRCRDLDRMSAFYQDVIGLERIDGAYRDGIVFLRIAAGFGGHTAVLALFQAEPDEGDLSPPSSLHHLALTVPFGEQEAAMRWYDMLGLDYSVQRFGWIGWRGVFTQDPEGNTVELVAYDISMLDKGSDGG